MTPTTNGIYGRDGNIPPIGSIPTECLSMIVAKLDSKTLRCFDSTCKTAQAVSDDEWGRRNGRSFYTLNFTFSEQALSYTNRQIYHLGKFLLLYITKSPSSANEFSISSLPEDFANLLNYDIRRMDSIEAPPQCLEDIFKKATWDACAPELLIVGWEEFKNGRLKNALFFFNQSFQYGCLMASDIAVKLLKTKYPTEVRKLALEALERHHCEPFFDLYTDPLFLDCEGVDPAFIWRTRRWLDLSEEERGKHIDTAVEKWRDKVLPEVLLQAASKKFRLYDFEEADALCVQALANCGKLVPPKILDEAARIQSDLGNVAKAKVLSELAIARYVMQAPRNVLVNMASMKSSEADVYKTRAIAKYEDKVSAYVLFSTAIAKYKLGLPKVAEAFAKQAMAKYGDEIPPGVLVDVAFIKLRLGKFEEAKKLCKQAMEEYGDEVPANVQEMASFLKLSRDSL